MAPFAPQMQSHPFAYPIQVGPSYAVPSGSFGVMMHPQSPASPASVSPLSGTPTGYQKSSRSRAFPSCTQAVLRFLREVAPTVSGAVGWEALQQLWNISPTHFDSAVLSYLHMKPQYLQQHILLTFATTNLTHVKNLSAFLSCVIQKLETPSPLCLFFLADCCHTEGCKFLHPDATAGWQVLWKNWQVGLQDFDYLVLNSLFQKPLPMQEDILGHLSNMKLKNINNLSALLSSVIQQHEKTQPAGARRSKAIPIMQAPPEGSSPPATPNTPPFSLTLEEPVTPSTPSSSAPSTPTAPATPAKVVVEENFPRLAANVDLPDPSPAKRAEEPTPQSCGLSLSPREVDQHGLSGGMAALQRFSNLVLHDLGDDLRDDSKSVMNADTINCILNSANLWLVGF
eukprot:EG_transcript_2279